MVMHDGMIAIAQLLIRLRLKHTVTMGHQYVYTIVYGREGS